MPPSDLYRSASPLIEKGDERVRSNDFEGALACYREALESDSADPDANAGLEYVRHLVSGRASRFDFGSVPDLAPHQRIREENRRVTELEFEAGNTILTAFPTHGFIEHTTRCNFYCPHCTKGYDPYFAEDISKNLLDDALEGILSRMSWVCITGFGEPTLGERYPEIMRGLVEKGVRPHFNTNTSTLTVPHIEALVKCDAHITLSIDGATRNTFETIRAGGSWDRLLNCLHAIKRIRAILGGSSCFDITFVAMRKNIEELPEMVRLTHRFGLDRLRVQDYYFYGIDYDDQSLRYDPGRANRCLAKAERVAERLGVSLLSLPPFSTGAPEREASLWKKALNTPRLFPVKDRFPQRCKAPWQEVKIHVDGRVAPCCFSDSGMGNIQKTPFEKIWNGFRYRIFRWRIRTFLSPRECRVCHSTDGINSGNPANVLLKEGRLLKVFYYLENLIHKWRFERRRRNEKPNYFKGKWMRSASDSSKGG